MCNKRFKKRKYIKEERSEERKTSDKGIRRRAGNIKLDIWSSPFAESMSHPARQEISNILRNPNVHYRFHNSPPLAPVLSQLNSVYTIFSSFS
jgi:hypothetical protein